MRARPLAGAAVAAALSACVQQSGYYWGNYDSALYQHYKNPQDREAFIEALKTTILEAEQRGMKVPPGICAEYGYALFEEGQAAESLPWFQREKETWPESTVLMDKMIRNAQRRVGQPPTPGKGPAGAVEDRS
ncbi:MAG TPA: DUF4810 domain-containing protein [Anaeromyxobacter sp.]|nr:DUF4810 domain-containing protein [Anaeromyxobacter sp.]